MNIVPFGHREKWLQSDALHRHIGIDAGVGLGHKVGMAFQLYPTGVEDVAVKTEIGGIRIVRESDVPNIAHPEIQMRQVQRF